MRHAFCAVRVIYGGKGQIHRPLIRASVQRPPGAYLRRATARGFLLYVIRDLDDWLYVNSNRMTYIEVLPDWVGFRPRFVVSSRGGALRLREQPEGGRLRFDNDLLADVLRSERVVMIFRNHLAPCDNSRLS